MKESLFTQRFNKVQIIFILWALAIAGRLFYFAVINRQEILQEMKTEMLKEVRIPAKRGRLLDPEGRELASSIRYVDFYIKKTAMLESDLNLFHREIPINISGVLARAKNSSQELVLIKKQATKDQYLRFEEFFHRPPYSTKFRFKRFYPQRRYRKVLGQVANTDVGRRGIRGLERKYDHRLRGQDLIYQVLEGHDGHRIEGSYRETQSLRTGYDVYVTWKDLGR